jgi:hypothetical protein
LLGAESLGLFVSDVRPASCAHHAEQDAQRYPASALT